MKKISRYFCVLTALLLILVTGCGAGKTGMIGKNAKNQSDKTPILYVTYNEDKGTQTFYADDVLANKIKGYEIDWDDFDLNKLFVTADGKWLCSFETEPYSENAPEDYKRSELFKRIRISDLSTDKDKNRAKIETFDLGPETYSPTDVMPLANGTVVIINGPSLYHIDDEGPTLLKDNFDSYNYEIRDDGTMTYVDEDKNAGWIYWGKTAKETTLREINIGQDGSVIGFADNYIYYRVRQDDDYNADYYKADSNGNVLKYDCSPAEDIFLYYTTDGECFFYDTHRIREQDDYAYNFNYYTDGFNTFRTLWIDEYILTEDGIIKPLSEKLEKYEHAGDLSIFTKYEDPAEGEVYYRFGTGSEHNLGMSCYDDITGLVRTEDGKAAAFCIDGTWYLCKTEDGSITDINRLDTYKNPVAVGNKIYYISDTKLFCAENSEVSQLTDEIRYNSRISLEKDGNITVFNDTYSDDVSMQVFRDGAKINEVTELSYGNTSKVYYVGNDTIINDKWGVIERHTPDGKTEELVENVGILSRLKDIGSVILFDADTY